MYSAKNFGMIHCSLVPLKFFFAGALSEELERKKYGATKKKTEGPVIMNAYIND